MTTMYRNTLRDRGSRVPALPLLGGLLAAAGAWFGCYGSSPFGEDAAIDHSDLDPDEGVADDAVEDARRDELDAPRDDCGSAAPEICNELDDDCDGIADDGLWCAVQPRHAQRTYADLWGASATDVWVVGVDWGAERGLVLRWDGELWIEDSPDGWYYFAAVSGDGGTGVWVAGLRWASPGSQEYGMLRRGATGWSEPWLLASDESVAGLSGVAEDDVWAVGSRSVRGSPDVPAIWHWTGSAWRPTPTPEGLDGVNLIDVHAFAPNDVWAVGQGRHGDEGVVLRWDGRIWAVVRRIAELDAVPAIWGTCPDDVWVTGGSQGLLHWDGGGWTDSRVPGSEFAWQIWGSSPDDLWVSGAMAEGLTLNRRNGGTWRSFLLEPPMGMMVTAIWGASRHEVWATGTRNEGGFSDATVWRWRE